MARKHYLNFKDIIDSYELLTKDIALLPAGIYRGFDVMETVSPTLVRFRHTETGAKLILENGSAVSNMAVLKTPQGVVVTETDFVELPVTLNTTQQDRFDAVILSHEWADVQGGSVSTFSIIQGTVGDGFPSIPNPNTKTVIGYIRVNSLSGTNGMVWKRNNPPQMAAFNLTEKANIWTKQQIGVKASLNIDTDNHVLDINDAANQFEIQHTAPIRIDFLNNRHDFTVVPLSGTVISLTNVGDEKVSFRGKEKHALEGVTQTPTGKKFMLTLTSEDIDLQPHGTIWFREEANHWLFLGIVDTNKHLDKIYKELDGKDWGFNNKFIEAVQKTIGYSVINNSKTSVTVNTSGVILNGTLAAQKNIYAVTVPSGIMDIMGFQTLHPVGTRLTLQFFLSDNEALIKRANDNTNDAKLFRSSNGFDYVVKTGSIVECIQMLDGLHIICGEPHIKWVTPTISGTGHSVLSVNGPLKYAFYPDGSLRFIGSMALSGAGSQLFFTIPSEKFRYPAVKMGGAINIAGVQPYDKPHTKYNNISYSEVMENVSGNFVSTGVFKFLVSISATETEITEIDMLFNGLTLSCR